MTDDQRWRGFVDSVDEPLVTGWAFDARNPNLPLLIQVTSDGGRKEIVRADIFRPDLKDHEIGDGRHGFVADLKNFSSADGAIEISILGSDRVLAKDIHLGTLSLRRAIPPVPESFSALMALMAVELRMVTASTAQGEADRSRLPDDLRSSPSENPHKSILLETAHLDQDPEGLISKFLHNEVIRLGGQDLRVKLAGTVKDRLDVLLWYIGEYSLRWGRSLSVPLSQTQLRFLNNPLPISEFPASISVALWNFLRRDRPDLLNITNQDVHNEALYWWCFEKTPQLNLERKLVTPDQISALREIDHTFSDRFPLSIFMRLYISKHPEIQCLNLYSSAGRLAAFHYFTLLSCKHPHVADLLPRSSIRTLLASESDGASHFEDNLSFFLHNSTDAKVLARQARWHVESHATVPCARPTQNAKRQATLATDFQNETKEGVTVIGPIDKTLGLGQATRLSYHILDRIIAPSLSALPFNFENPALVGYSSPIAYREHAQLNYINLIHLNADFVPLAFSVLSDSTFKNKYNIGYFFWELNIIPKSHFLALELLDEIWVSSNYVQEMYQKQTSKPVVNVGMAVEDLPPSLEPHPYLCKNRAFTFLTTFDSFSFVERKNPTAVVRAFQEAFDKENGEVGLIIKTWNKNRISDTFQISAWRAIDNLIRDDPRIEVIDEVFTYEQILSLKLACNCYVSLHRAEGFGFGMLEAMQLGRPVIATAYSGNLDFCTPENSYLVDYDLVSVGYDEYPFVERGSVWADPKIASAAAAMRSAFLDRNEAAKKGARAAQFVKDNFSIQMISKRYKDRLNKITASSNQ